MLAEVFYRGDDFEKAAASLTGIDVATNPLIVSQYPTLNVAKLQSFKGQTPYELHGVGQSIRVKFMRTDPLPFGQCARERRRRGHVLHRHRRLGGRTRH
jgi:hypothetical protein